MKSGGSEREGKRGRGRERRVVGMKEEGREREREGKKRGGSERGAERGRGRGRREVGVKEEGRERDRVYRVMISDILSILATRTAFYSFRGTKVVKALYLLYKPHQTNKQKNAMLYLRCSQ